MQNKCKHSDSKNDEKMQQIISKSGMIKELFSF